MCVFSFWFILLNYSLSIESTLNSSINLYACLISIFLVINGVLHAWCHIMTLLLRWYLYSFLQPGKNIYLFATYELACRSFKCIDYIYVTNNIQDFTFSAARVKDQLLTFKPTCCQIKQREWGAKVDGCVSKTRVSGRDSSPTQLLISFSRLLKVIVEIFCLNFRLLHGKVS